MVNRIDRNTRGIVLAAKNAESLRILSSKIKQREIDKYYLCRVYGIIDPKSGVLHDYLTRNEKTKMVNVTKKPVGSGYDEIITEYKTLSHDAKTS
ncbi:hypothetical protein FACS1894166_05940 [Bacilli bacterium]|nr:hypothetical protein FACS1894166_05940 [Bacilli bacterium]